MRFHLVIPVICLSSLNSFAQLSTDRNFVSKSDIKQPGITTQTAVDALSVTGKVQQVGYFDGLGRPLQQIIVQGSPSGKDIISLAEFDNYGREIKKFLPYTDQNSGNPGSFRSTMYSDQANFYSTGNTSVNVARDNFPFIQTHVEFSPVGRQLENGSAGETWQPGSGHTVKMLSLLNTVNDDVKKWDVTENAGTFGTYATPEIYVANELFKTIAFDEHGKQVIEFKDREGKVILKKVQLTAAADNGAGNGHAGWLCTYYVYDALNNLRCVIQPKGVELVSASSWALTDVTILAEQCFRYEYDERRRMIMKKVPGAAEVYMIYDARDRLVHTQDGNMRSKDWWITTLYDGLNRPMATGITVYTGTRAQLMAHVSDVSNLSGASITVQGSALQQNITIANRETGRTLYQASSTIEFNPGFESETNGEFTAEIITGSGSSSIMQTLGNPFPAGATFTALTLSYYDDYSFTSKAYSTADNTKLDAGNNPNPETLPAAANEITKGLPTGSRIWVMEDPNTLSNGRWVESVIFYDGKGRPVQSQNDNYKGGIEIATTRYDFIGQVLCTYLVHNNPSAASGTIRIKTNMEYDNTGKLLTIKKQLNDNAATDKVIVTHEYDELSQLKKKMLGINPLNTTLPLETLTYDYNIRGWMLGTNRTYAKTSSNTENYFGFDLGYDQMINTYTNAQYNGNIGGTVWKTKGDNEVRKYDFTYDAVNRLTGADFNQYTSSSFNKTAGVDFSVGNLNFDANGNILSMNQTGLKLTASSLIDQLSYSYQANTNKLQAVTDASNDFGSKLGDFKYEPFAKTFTDYRYDVNGNMTADNNKNISSITYNHLNLPSVITVTDKGTITYLYDAAGNKLQKKTVEGSTVTSTSYVSGFVYNNDTLQFTGHEEGRIRYKVAANEFAYDFFLKDHLGNVRMVLTDEVQQAAYPPASMETENSTTENALYSNVDATRNDLPADYPTNDTYTSPNNKVSKTNGNGNKIGPSIVLKVMSGDRFNLRVSDWYKTNGATPGTPLSPLTALLSSLTGNVAILSNKTTSIDLNNNGILSSGATSFLSNQNGNNYNTSKPKAFVNWILFDEQFKFVESSSGSEQVGGDNASSVTVHTKSDMPVSKNGYLYIYVSNETPNIDVYFDNLQVTHINGAILEETHYYPFGLTMAGISSKAFGGIENLKKYNGIEETRDLDLNEYDAFYRTLDPQTGRWWQIDPKADSLYGLSPYNSMVNNPIYVSDPNGDMVEFAENSTAEFKAKVLVSIVTLLCKGVGDNFIRLAESSKSYTLEENTGSGNKFSGNEDGSGGVILWNPNQATNSTNNIKYSPTTSLNHEFDHAADYDLDHVKHFARQEIKDKNYKNAEEKRVITGWEQRTAAAMGEIKPGQTTRFDHSYMDNIQVSFPNSTSGKITSTNATQGTPIVVEVKRTKSKNK